MNDPSFDADAAERMLSGQLTGPPELAELLAAASRPASEDLRGEEAAVAAFREARALRSRQPRRRRPAALVSLKAALIGLLLILAGGITAASAAQHLPGPLRHEHHDNTRTPTSRPVLTHAPPGTPSRPNPDQHDKQGKQSADATHPGTAHTSRHPAHPHPAHPTHLQETAHPKNTHMPPKSETEHSEYHFARPVRATE